MNFVMVLPFNLDRTMQKTWMMTNRVCCYRWGGVATLSTGFNHLLVPGQFLPKHGSLHAQSKRSINMYKYRSTIAFPKNTTSTSKMTLSLRRKRPTWRFTSTVMSSSSSSSSSATTSTTTTQSLPWDTVKWDHQISNLIEQGLIMDAQTMLESIHWKYRTTDISPPRTTTTTTTKTKNNIKGWIHSKQMDLFNAWIQRQQSILDMLTRKTQFSLHPANDLDFVKERLQDIIQIAHQAHILLEQIEPSLGARNIRIDNLTSIQDDDDNNNNNNNMENANDVDNHAKSEFQNDQDYTHDENVYDEAKRSVVEETKNVSARPVIHSKLVQQCNDVLNVWACAAQSYWKYNVPVPGGIPQRATFLLERMETSMISFSESSSSSSSSSSLASHVYVPPTIDTYNYVLQCWAYSQEHLRGSASERIFARIKHPNGISYRGMIRAWALSYGEDRFAFEATGHLMQVLRLLERTQTMVNIASNYDTDLEPTLEDYQLVMKAWSLSEEKRAPFKAQSIMSIVEIAFKKGITMIQPDEVCYRCLLQTAARRPNLPDLGPLVDETLQRMRNNYMVPDTECFTAAIQTWKHYVVRDDQNIDAPTREAGIRRILELLSEMEMSDHQSTLVSVQVSTANVNDALEALTVSNDLKRMEIAEHLLSKMEQAMVQGREILAPNCESFVHVLRTWSTHKTIEKVAKAKVILLRMQEYFAAIANDSEKKVKASKELVNVFNEYIRVCGSYAAPSNKIGMQILKKALSENQNLQRLGNMRPNSTTYAALLNACGNLLSTGMERQIVVEKIFTLCCNDGMIDGNVLEEMRSVATQNQFSTLVMASSKTVEGIQVLPSSWTANTVGKSQKIHSQEDDASRRRGGLYTGTPYQLSIDGKPAITSDITEYRMRRLRKKKNRSLLQGGRLKKSPRTTPWRLHDPAMYWDQL